MAAQGGAEDVYASLLLTDSYLPGALVLAHSLRDAGTKKKLAILVTLDSVSAEVVTQLKTVYDYVISVPRIRNERPANLYLMNRPDLHSAFTKINLWKQTQFRRIVYLDADVLAYRAPDELFDLPHDFSAAPDIGWPDLFNTGVMALTPNMGDYYAMMAMAQRGISFDGADQGLLNMHFKNTYHRLSFTYNVTPSAHYQYVPAYRHFQSSINLVHFIGSEKPWLQGREKSTGDTPFDEIAGRWWAVYDRHYRKETITPGPQQAPPAQRAPELVQYFVKGEYQPTVRYVVPVGEVAANQPGVPHGQHYQPAPPLARVEQYHDHQHSGQFDHHPAQTESHHPVQHDSQPFSHVQNHHDHNHDHHDHNHDHHDHHHEHYHDHHHEHHEQQDHPPQHHDQHHEPYYHHHQPQASSSGQQPEHPSSHPSVSFQHDEGTHTEARAEQAPGHQGRGSQATPPPPEPRAEPFQPPLAQSWDAQRQPPPSDSRPEAYDFPQTHYEMSSDPTPFVPPERYPSPPKNMWYEVPKEPPASAREKPRAIFPWESHQPAPSRIFPHHERPDSPATDTPAASFGSPTVEPKSEPQTPPTPALPVIPSDPWTSFPRSNAWDDVPEINRYVDAIQKHQRTRSQGLGKTLPELRLHESSWGRRGSKVTDFPSEDDRPSLPVTPAPIRRPRFWGGGRPGLGLGDDESDKRLPAAEGVPTQSDWVCVHGYRWSPADCPCDLTNLLRYYKDPLAQLQKLAEQQSDLLHRLGESTSLGDEAIGTEGQEIPSRPLPFGSEDMKSPTYVAFSPPELVSPKPRKPDTGTSPVQHILEAGLDGSPLQAPPAFSSGIQQPSYQGPGAAFEKGEDVPLYETPALPTDEDRDVLET